MKYLILRKSGYVLLGLLATSIILAVMGVMGVKAHSTLFFSIFVLLISISLFLYAYGGAKHSRGWICFAASWLAVCIIIVIDFLRGGGHLLPAFNGRLWCIDSMVFISIGAIVFYFTDWRKGKLTVLEKRSLVVFALTFPAVSALYLCGAPLWLSYLVLYAGFGLLYYGLRAILFRDDSKKNGVKFIHEDDIH